MVDIVTPRGRYTVDTQSEWYEKRDKLSTEICTVTLENGFSVELKPDSNKKRFTDFRQNNYLVSFHNDKLVLYDNEDEALEELGTIMQIDQS